MFEDYTYPTDQDLDREAVYEIGSNHPNKAWILSPRDVWYENPHYNGPAQPHPESFEWEY